jgi:hypothetical protein
MIAADVRAERLMPHPLRSAQDAAAAAKSNRDFVPPWGMDWRTEADDEWLATHKSQTFARFRRRLARLGLAGPIGDAVSRAELGPFGGAPRNPQLKLGGKTYSVIRYTEHRIAYTTISVDLQRCRRCGGLLVEVHRVTAVDASGVRSVVGAVRMCRRCQADSWLFYSRMPATRRARRRARKVVL